MEYNDGAFRQPGDDVYVDIDSGTASSYKESGIRFQHGSVTRWVIEKDNVANADLYIRRYNSSGALQDSPISIAGASGDITIAASQAWTLAADDVLSIDAATTDHTAATVFTTDLDIDSASCTLFNATIDVGTLLSAGEIVKGIYFDINSLASDAATSSIIGTDLLMTAIATSEADLYGHRILFDGTRDTDEPISGFIVNGASLIINSASAILHGLTVEFASVTDTDYATGDFNGIDIAMPAAYQGTDVASAIKATGAGAQVDILSGAGTIYGVDLTLAAATRGIWIDAGSTNQAADKNIIDIDCDVEGAYSVNAINVNFDFDTTGMGAADTCSILTADINELLVHTNNCIMYGTDITMTGFATGRADLIGHQVTFDGTKNQGDLEAGLRVVSTTAVAHSGEVHAGTYIDFSGISSSDGTVYGDYIDVSFTDNSDAYGSYITVGTDTNAGLCITGGSATAGIDLSGLTATDDIILSTGGNIQNLIDLVSMGLGGDIVVDTFPFNTVTLTEATAAYAKAEDGGVFLNLSATSGGGGYTNDYAIFPDTELENDACNFGAATPFGAMYIDISATAATYGADSVIWEYWNGAWVTLTIVYDYTDSTAQDGQRPFMRDGYIVWSAPTDWATTTIDGQLAYWIRARVKAGFNITQIPETNSKEHQIPSDANAFELPYAGTISRCRFQWDITSTGTNDTQVVLCNLTTGAASALTTITKALSDFQVANLAMTVAADDELAFFIAEVDTGGTEYGDGHLEMKVTRT